MTQTCFTLFFSSHTIQNYFHLSWILFNAILHTWLCLNMIVKQLIFTIVGVCVYHNYSFSIFSHTIDSHISYIHIFEGVRVCVEFIIFNNNAGIIFKWKVLYISFIFVKTNSFDTNYYMQYLHKLDILQM